MQHFFYVVIFSNPILEIKLVVILLLVRVSQIGRKKEKIQTHVESPNSVHNQASSKCQDLLNQNKHIQTIFFKQSDQARIEYRTHLNASVDCVKFLLRQGLGFCGHNESENSSNQGNFLEHLKFLANHNEDIKVVALSNAPQNLKLTSPDIQKDIVNGVAFEAINVITRDLGDALFSILIDEAHDISIKKQMAVQAVENLFSRLGLSISRLRGQGYDGACNMQTVAKNHNQITLIFTLVSNVVNVVGASCELSQALQRKDQDIVNAMNLVQISKVRLQKMRECGWTSLFDDILSFCEKHKTDVPQIDDMKKLIHLVEFYPKEFSSVELMVLIDQLDTYIIDILSSSEFSVLNVIADLAKKVVETGKDKVYSLMYLLLTLALILPVATTLVEMVFSAMNTVKNWLRNRMGDEWINDSLVVNIERDIFYGIDNDTIMQRFQKMKTHQGQL
ncbi:uncharacterized protein LOC114319683 [Camellia sinensis]|uniref:uncharacterized protein LOC114319683 n=1 Tax=Camellia sinensis TaxID=4442 RepID=UPI001035A1F5|nr:uncharacterized protein LOC114319683 [Camellia sinensis]